MSIETNRRMRLQVPLYRDWSLRFWPLRPLPRALVHKLLPFMQVL